MARGDYQSQRRSLDAFGFGGNPYGGEFGRRLWPIGLNCEPCFDLFKAQWPWLLAADFGQIFTHQNYIHGVFVVYLNKSITQH
jgi:hypothetical protein